MTETQKTLCFSVQGEFITNLAREWLFCEGKDFDKIIDLLESCMCGTDMSEKKIRRYAEDILLLQRMSKILHEALYESLQRKEKGT